MPNEDGHPTHTFHQLAHGGITYFWHLLKGPQGVTLVEIIRFSILFPHFVDRDSTIDLINLASIGELEITLKWFKNDKIHGRDGWFVEIYLAFFETMGKDLLKVVEECRLFGHMYEVVNSTFISLISKVDSPLSFNDFRPISLYKCLYKIIAKIIANRLNPILSSHISFEQFFFA